jgi:hypothetical protein
MSIRETLILKGYYEVYNCITDLLTFREPAIQNWPLSQHDNPTTHSATL